MLNIIEINNFNAPELDVYARYTEAQLLNKDRPEDGLFYCRKSESDWTGVGCRIYSNICSG